MALSPSDISIPFHTYVAQAEPYVRDLVTWTPPSGVANLLGLFGTICIIYWIAWLSLRPRQSTSMGEGDMVKHFRNARVRFFVGEGVTEFVEEGVFKEKITREEAIDVYTKIGKAFGLVDLLPKKKPKQKLSRGETEHLKEQIKSRVEQQTVVPFKPKLGRKLKSS